MIKLRVPPVPRPWGPGKGNRSVCCASTQAVASPCCRPSIPIRFLRYRACPFDNGDSLTKGTWAGVPLILLSGTVPHSSLYRDEWAGAHPSAASSRNAVFRRVALISYGPLLAVNRPCPSRHLPIRLPSSLSSPSQTSPLPFPHVFNRFRPHPRLQLIALQSLFCNCASNTGTARRKRLTTLSGSASIQENP
jgi:hypothetical protein